MFWLFILLLPIMIIFELAKNQNNKKPGPTGPGF